MNLKVRGFRRSDRFDSDIKQAPPDIVDAAQSALKLLQQNPRASSLRVHTVKAWGKPTIFKLDVFTNHSWQITFNLDGEVAVLLRLAPHKECDRNPRG